VFHISILHVEFFKFLEQRGLRYYYGPIWNMTVGAESAESNKVYVVWCGVLRCTVVCDSGEDQTVKRQQKADSRQQTADRRHQTADST
jgi:hypothetical protein